MLTNAATVERLKTGHCSSPPTVNTISTPTPGTAPRIDGGLVTALVERPHTLRKQAILPRARFDDASAPTRVSHSSSQRVLATLAA